MGIFQKRIGSLCIGRKVKFINKGTIESQNAYLGSITNLSVNLSNKSKRSFFLNEGFFKMGKMSRIHMGFGIHIGPEAEFIVGNDTYINPDSIIVCHKQITIGDNCAISWGCQFLDDDLHSIINNNNRMNIPSAINVGNNVWIGAGVKILSGSKISDGVIIAAGSVVKGKLDSNCIYAGVPAKKIRENVRWK